MIAKGKAAEVEVVAVVAVAAGGRKLWLDIYHRENLIALVIAATAMAITAIVVIPAVVVMVLG